MLARWYSLARSFRVPFENYPDLQSKMKEREVVRWNTLTLKNISFEKPRMARTRAPRDDERGVPSRPASRSPTVPSRRISKLQSRPVPRPAAFCPVPSRPVPYDQFSEKVKNSQNHKRRSNGGVELSRCVWNRPETPRVRPEKSENELSSRFSLHSSQNRGLHRETSSDYSWDWMAINRKIDDFS